MTKNELLMLSRRVLDDADGAMLWTNNDLIGYLNAAQNEVARRTFCLDDIVQVRMNIDGNAQTIPPGILLIESAHFFERTDMASPPLTLVEVPRGDMTFLINMYEGAALGSTPICYHRQPKTTEILVHPRPSGGVLRLVVRRLLTPPELFTTELLDQESVIPEEYHRGMVDWVLVEAYKHRDSDSHSPELVREAERRFTAEFGKRQSARSSQSRFIAGGRNTVYPRSL